MNRFALFIELQNQHAWPFVIVGVILDNHGVDYTVDNILNENVIACQLIVAVIGNKNALLCYEFLNLIQSVTHSRGITTTEISRHRDPSMDRRACDSRLLPKSPPDPRPESAGP